MISELHTVFLLSNPPEEFDPHQIWPIWGVEAEGNIMGLAPLGHIGAGMVRGVVHKERKLVAWVLLLDLLERLLDAVLVK